MASRLYIQPHIRQDRRQENSRSIKMTKCSPWTLSEPLRRNWHHELCSSRRKTAYSDSVSIMGNGKLTASWFRPWTSLSTRKATQLYFRLWTRSTDIARPKLLKTIGTKKCLHHTTLFSTLHRCCLGGKLQGTFQLAMDVLLTWHFALLYLDDIVKFLQTSDNHIGHARQVGVTWNLRQVLHILHWWSPTFQLPWTPQSIDRHDWRHTGSLPPCNHEGTSTFLRFVWHLSPFGAELRTLAAPLNNELREGQLQAVNGLKDEKITTLAILGVRLLEPWAGPSTIARRLYIWNWRML